ncbi:MAG: hypothetical protein IT448_09915 [Phycisphaerales bacterium]|nr:hypothetical protein [Phycisphaerales bacterium]
MPAPIVFYANHHNLIVLRIDLARHRVHRNLDPPDKKITVQRTGQYDRGGRVVCSIYTGLINR